MPAALFAELKGVEIFATGDHGQGDVFTDQDLAEMEANFKRFMQGPKPLLQPPLVAGHEEDQKLLQRTDTPAAGWVKRLWREPATQADGKPGTVLKADFGDVPPPWDEWIRQHRFRKVSAEIYDSPQQAGLPGSGKVLRRVALLGAELPRVKGLADLPAPVPAKGGDGATTSPRYPARLRFSDAQRAKGWRRITFFSERTAVMDRETMMKMAQGYGLSEEFLKGLDDTQLGQLIVEWQRMQGGGPAPTPTETPPADTGMSEGAPPPAPAPATGAGPVPAGNPSQVILKYSELDRRFKTLEQKMTAQEQLAQARLVQEREATVKTFCERMVREKKMTPAEADPASKVPNTYQRLLRADPVQKVHKFGEKGESLSELELQMKEIETRDPATVARLFSEKLSQPAGGAVVAPDRKQALLASSPLGRAALKRTAK